MYSRKLFWVAALSAAATTAFAQPTTTLTFQQGLNGYTGTTDTYFQTGNPFAVHGSSDQWEWDGSDGDGQNFGLLRFNRIFGTGDDLIPPNATIVKAELTLHITDSGAAEEVATFHNLLRPFTESMNLTVFTTNPVPTADSDYEAAVVVELPGPPSGAPVTLDVTSSIARWHADELLNYGWIVVPGGGNGVGVGSANVSTYTIPTLTVETGIGTFVFRNGLNGYSGTVDTWVNTGNEANQVQGLETHFEFDGEDAGGENFGLVRFDGIIGTGENQIPVGTSILSATLTIQNVDSGNNGRLHDILAGAPGESTHFTDDATTMRNFGNGVAPRAGIDYAQEPVVEVVPGATGVHDLNVTASLVRYAAGEANLGWIFAHTGTNGVEVVTSEAGGTSSAPPPLLTVEFTVAE